MTATVLDFFIDHSNDKFIQFLTWYIVLVKQWKLEDIAGMEVGAWRPDTWGGYRATLAFNFHNGDRESWSVVKNEAGYYVDVSWKLVRPAEETEAASNG